MTAIKGRFVRLAEIGDIPTPRHDTYSPELMERARVHHVARGLTFDNKTGELRDCTGNLSRLVRPSEHEPMQDVESVMRWHFRPLLANSASRMTRGYAP
jgi:hypothetical protein